MSRCASITRRLALFGPPAAVIPATSRVAVAACAFDAALADYHRADAWMRRRDVNWTDEDLDAAIDAATAALIRLIRTPASTPNQALALLEIAHQRLHRGFEVDDELAEIPDDAEMMDDLALADEVLVEAAIRALRTGRR